MRRAHELGVDPIIATVGVKEGLKPVEALINAGVSVITIDIAHGHHQMMFDLISQIKTTWPTLEVIAGNVCTPEATLALIEAGVDAIKVGVGPGSVCKTRKVAGVGLGQLTAVAICAQAAKESGVPIIADGNINGSDDIVKALAAGASTVMFGRLFAGTDEASGPIEKINGQPMMRYGGMASNKVRKDWRPDHDHKESAEEGEVIWVPLQGPVHGVIDELVKGVRLGMSYVGAFTVSQLQANHQFSLVTPAVALEATPHALLTNHARP